MSYVIILCRKMLFSFSSLMSGYLLFSLVVDQHVQKNQEQFVLKIKI